jgi:hypothetical protein
MIALSWLAYVEVLRADDNAQRAKGNRLRSAVIALGVAAASMGSGARLAGSPTSTIIGFAPTVFAAKADAKFFYAIDKDLKNSNEIDPGAPTLAHGPFGHAVVSPDGSKIAIVAQHTLLIIGTDASSRKVTPVDTIHRSFKHIGREFFRDEGFQWSADSRSLYLIRDKYYRSKGLQLFSKNGELWRYDLASGNLALVITPFLAYQYVLDVNSDIYYWVDTPSGSLQMKRFDGHVSTNAYVSDVRQPFYSFNSVTDYEAALASMSVRLEDDHGGIESLVIDDRKYLSVTQGKGWDGYYFCADLLRSVFLPGHQFFLLNTPYCGNYNGQLLFELSSGRYRTLPPDTVVFSTLNTMNFTKYHLTAGGIEIK